MLTNGVAKFELIYYTKKNLVEMHYLWCSCVTTLEGNCSAVEYKKISPSEEAGSQVRPRHGCRPRCDFYWLSLSPRSARPSSSLVFITRVTNDSISIHICSNWSMRETIVSGVSWAPTARPTASLATSHLAQTKRVYSTLSTRDLQ